MSAELCLKMTNGHDPGHQCHRLKNYMPHKDKTEDRKTKKTKTEAR